MPAPMTKNLFFSCAKNSDVYIELIVLGIIAILTICIIRIASSNCGNKTGIKTGATKIGITASIIEKSIVNFFNFLLEYPLASRGKIY